MKKLLLTLVGMIGSIHLALSTTCPNAQVIPAAPSFPYTQSLVCGTGNDITSANAPACGATSYLGGLESVYTWTPSVTYPNATINYSGQSWSAIFVFAGCPTSGGTCVGSITGSGTTQTLNIASFTAGVTYFFVFDTWPSPPSPCAGTFTLNVAPPANPPTPTQAAGIPSCATGTTIDVVGTPDANVTWYWQTTATGTSTADAYAGPYTVIANGTYYLRAFNTATMIWSTGSSSVVVSDFPTALAPPAPTADQNPACVTTGSILTAAAAGAGYEYYWQGTISTGSSNALPATSTYTVTSSGTYYLAAYETATQCWSAGTGIAISINSTVPATPTTVTPDVYACSGAPSIMVNAVPTGLPVTYTLKMNDSWGDGWNGNTIHVMANGVNVITSATFNTGLTSSVTFTAQEGQTITTQFNGIGSFVSECSFQILNESAVVVASGNYLANIPPYVIPLAPYVINWYDAITGGNNIGTGSPLEAVGTTILPTAANGDYIFYAGSSLNGCSSVNHVPVTVHVTDVNVTIDPIDVSCNNGNDGSFVIGTISCGTAPFTFSVDGGAFGPAPTNLEVGTYDVIVQDGLTNQSSTYTVVIGDATAPSGVIVNTFNNDIVDLSWLAGGSETSWNVEWGTPGFTPGTGTEIGSDTATDTTIIISGLDGNTAYEFYISANCGAGTTAGSWISTTVTTLCDPLVAQGFCESFDADSDTKACWSVNNANADGDAWTLSGTLAPFAGQSAEIYTDFNGGNNNDWLISPGMMLTGNEILTFKYRTYSAFEPNDMRVMLSTTGTDPADFTEELAGLFTVGNTVYLDSSINLSAYSGTCYIAFHIPSGGLDGWYLMIDDVCVDICTPAPGVDGTVDVCRLDGSLDLNTVITQGENNGVWQFAPNASAVAGSMLNVTAIPDGMFTAEYIVTTACTMDTTVATFNVYPASSAGTNGQINVCKNQPVNLLSGLSGLVDLGGTWLNPSSVVLPSGQITSGSLPGQFNYNYITSNGVCPNDTANVIVNISATCDWTGIEELNADAITVYPNPSTGLFYIYNSDASQNFNYEVLDLNGRVIAESTKEVNGSATIEVDLTNVENGIYMIKLFNESGAKLVRVVKQ